VDWSEQIFRFMPALEATLHVGQSLFPFIDKG